MLSVNLFVPVVPIKADKNYLLICANNSYEYNLRKEKNKIKFTVQGKTVSRTETVTEGQTHS